MSRLVEDLDTRLARTRQDVAEQRQVLRALRRDSKEFLATFSAVRDEAVAVALAAEGVLNKPVPPVPTRVPKEL